MLNRILRNLDGTMRMPKLKTGKWNVNAEALNADAVCFSKHFQFKNLHLTNFRVNFHFPTANVPFQINLLCFLNESFSC